MIIRRCSTKGAFEVIPDSKDSKLDFSSIKDRFKINFEIPSLIIFDFDVYSVSCFKNGKILIKNCDSETVAEKIVEVLYNG